MTGCGPGKEEAVKGKVETGNDTMDDRDIYSKKMYKCRKEREGRNR